MLEIQNYESLNFTDHQMEFMSYAKNHYVKQLKEAQVPENESTIAILRTIDEINTENLEKKKDEMIPSCKKGCAHCCYIQVGMTLREANLIKEYVDTFHIPVDKEKLKIQAQIENEKEYLISPNRRCVFLGQNNLCTIYEVRPSACRNYFVFNPKEDCDTFNDKTTGKTLVNFDLESVAPIMALMSISPTNTLPRQLLKIL